MVWGAVPVLTAPGSSFIQVVLMVNLLLIKFTVPLLDNL